LQPEKPHEQNDAETIVVHLATREVACRAGGRGFESRRSRFSKCLHFGVSVPGQARRRDLGQQAGNTRGAGAESLSFKKILQICWFGEPYLSPAD